MKRLLSTCAAGALVVGGGIFAAPQAHSAEPPSYSVMLLHSVASDSDLEWDGVSGVSAYGLNNNGDVVGTVWGMAGSLGLLWNARSGIGGFIDGLTYDGSALDIAGDRTILGSASGVPARALYLKADGTGGSYDFEWGSTPYGISETGVALVSGKDAEDEDAKPYTTTGPAELTELLPPEGMTGGHAQAISENGRNVAGIATSGDTTVPVVWTDGTAKPVTPPSRATATDLLAVNDSGQAAGCSVVNGTQLPYLYDASGTPTALPLLPGHESGCASAMNNAGVIVGHSEPADPRGSRPTIWLEGTPHDLNGLVPNRSGYTLTSISDINASGQVVGAATLANGSSLGFIATPSTAETIYTAPGTHHFNGRDWKTTCEPYSQTTRCRTEIIATQVQYKNGTYSRVTDWAFNNLTYNPSPREHWANNPLGNKGEWTADDGRKWRTECDTANTGRNGCRSHVFARVADATPKPGGGYSFSVTEKWVFNNIVKFS